MNSSVHEREKKRCLQENPGEFEEFFCNSVLPDQKKTTFYLVSRYEQWDGLPVQTRNSNHGPDKIQDHSSSSSNTQGTEKKKKKRPRRNVSEKKGFKYSSKKLLFRLYFIHFSSRLFQCCFLSRLSHSVNL